MGKKQKQQKRLIKELESALAQTLSDWAIERQANRSLREVIVNDRQRHDVDAMTNGMQRLRKERDAALADVAELLRDEEASTSCIRDLRRFVAQLQEERDELRLELAGMTSDAALDAALADVETLTQANAEADKTIGELRGDLAEVRGELERVTESWQHAEDLLQARERELDALRDQQAQQEHAEPVVTLQAIEELEEGERLIDEDGVIIESIPGGYEVRGAIFQAFKATPVDALQYYHEITGK